MKKDKTISSKAEARKKFYKRNKSAPNTIYDGDKLVKTECKLNSLLV